MACLCSNYVFKPGRRQVLGGEGSSLSDVVVLEANKSGILNCYESIEGNSGEVCEYDRYYFNSRNKYQALAHLMEDGKHKVAVKGAPEVVYSRYKKFKLSASQTTPTLLFSSTGERQHPVDLVTNKV